MTYIESAWATGWLLEVEDCNLNPDMHVTVMVVDSWGAVKAQATVNRKDLMESLLGDETSEALKALGLAKLIEVQRAEDSARMARAGEDAAERLLRAAEAKLAEVSDILEDMDPRRMDPVVNRLRAVLKASKPFELPVEVPARIEARHEGRDDPEGLVLMTDGESVKWVDEDAILWTPDQVMTYFSGHRLLE